VDERERLPGRNQRRNTKGLIAGQNEGLLQEDDEVREAAEAEAGGAAVHGEADERGGGAGHPERVQLY
jgi:hypothetical protein